MKYIKDAPAWVRGGRGLSGLNSSPKRDEDKRGKKALRVYECHCVMLAWLQDVDGWWRSPKFLPNDTDNECLSPKFLSSGTDIGCRRSPKFLSNGTGTRWRTPPKFLSNGTETGYFPGSVYLKHNGDVLPEKRYTTTTTTTTTTTSNRQYCL
jgi:hypothetical protein